MAARSFLSGLWRVADPRISLASAASLFLGAAAAARAIFFYHARPLALSDRGLGEAAVALCYGPLIAGGTFLVQRGAIDAALLLPSAPLGLMIAAFLWINEFPDYRADRAAGKRTRPSPRGRRTACSAIPRTPPPSSPPSGGH